MGFRKRDFLILMIVLFGAYSSHVSASESTSLEIRGRIVRLPHENTRCLVQLRKPAWVRVIDEEEARDYFSVHLPKPSVSDSVIVEIACDGYRVYSSKPIDSGAHLIDVGIVDASKRLDMGGCRELTGLDGERATQELLSIFMSEVKLPRDKTGANRPEDCEDRIYLIVEGLDEFSGPGQHWIVEKNKKSGKITVEQGM